MPIEKLLTDCKARMPWPTMRTVLKTLNLPVGQGWDATITKLLIYQQQSQDNAKRINGLEDAYFEHMLTGERSVRLFDASEGKIETLMSSLNGFNVKESIYHETFPYPLSEERLKDADSSTVLVRIENQEEGVAFIFCTKRFITERHELNLDDFKPETRDDLRDYEEVIAIKHSLRQLFDIVVVSNKNQTVEVRIDMSGGLSSDDQFSAFKSVIRAFNSIVNDLTGDDNFLGTPINLFPLLNKFYLSEEGRICELGFTTDDASIKHEKMRRKDFDLRAETYHMAGKDAVPALTPYMLGICWTVSIKNDIENKPELTLPGHIRLLSMEQPFLADATIRKCCCVEDYNFVVDKIKNYLE